MITVCFYGNLRQFGRRFALHAATPAEALHALFTQIKGLRQHIRDGFYQVRWQGQDYNESDLKSTFKRPGSGTLHIVPRNIGAGRVAQVVVGVVLLVIAYFVPVTAPYLAPAGVGLIMGGVAQMLTKTPKMDGGNSIEQSKNTSFSNLDNTAAQGRPVPLAYGLCYCGSRVVSQGVESRRISTGNTTSENSGGMVQKMIADSRRKQGNVENVDPMAVDLTLGIAKTFVQGVAATAPNGQKYDTDFSDDSVRAQNYIASYTV
ncbi:tail assembly protein [Neisseria weixii]|uniref:Tail assembly protein n=1 Tax=Neisseria weixii TaxID=1853276 RepID=A0A3N4N2A2_9NEIS|nr:tail assembly protein [Neisseria weixii]RPD90364.1 tail assembly protein [Neisseria weixii]RPD90535.1 tail assembly protein [Neisseria weixii]